MLSELVPDVSSLLQSVDQSAAGGGREIKAAAPQKKIEGNHFFLEGGPEPKWRQHSVKFMFEKQLAFRGVFEHTFCDFSCFLKVSH